MSSDKVKLYNRLTLIVSFIVPTLVALLLFLKWNADKLIFDLRSPNFEPIVLLENLPFAICFCLLMECVKYEIRIWQSNYPICHFEEYFRRRLIGYFLLREIGING